MTYIRLVAFILSQSIFPVVTEYAASKQHRTLHYAFCLALAMNGSLMVWGFLAGCRSGRLRSTWDEIWNPGDAQARRHQRSCFLALGVLTVFNSFAAVMAFQGGVKPVDPNAAEGSGTVASLVDMIGSLMFGVALTFTFDRSDLRVSRPKVLCIALALVCAAAFIVFKGNSGRIDWDSLYRPEVYFALLWAFFGAINAQLIRVFTRKQIDRDVFLFWRFLGPSVIFLSIYLVQARHGDRYLALDMNALDALLGMLALGSGYLIAVQLQYSLLNKMTVAALNAADLARPGVAYLLAVSFYRSGRQNPYAFASIWLVFLLLIAAETIPEALARNPGVSPRPWEARRRDLAGTDQRTGPGHA